MILCPSVANSQGRVKVTAPNRVGPLGSVFNQDQDDLGGAEGYRGSGNILDQYPLLPEVHNGAPQAGGVKGVSDPP